jgi:hypothetical protein
LRSLLDDKLTELGISAQAYHGGDLNGVACRELMEKAERVFRELARICRTFVGKLDTNGKTMNTATVDEVEKICGYYSVLFRMLGAAYSILRRGWGEATEEDGKSFETCSVFV